MLPVLRLGSYGMLPVSSRLDGGGIPPSDWRRLRVPFCPARYKWMPKWCGGPPAGHIMTQSTQSNDDDDAPPLSPMAALCAINVPPPTSSTGSWPKGVVGLTVGHSAKMMCLSWMCVVRIGKVVHCKGRPGRVKGFGPQILYAKLQCSGGSHSYAYKRVVRNRVSMMSLVSNTLFAERCAFPSSGKNMIQGSSSTEMPSGGQGADAVVPSGGQGQMKKGGYSQKHSRQSGFRVGCKYRCESLRPRRMH